MPFEILNFGATVHVTLDAVTNEMQTLICIKTRHRSAPLTSIIFLSIFIKKKTRVIIIFIWLKMYFRRFYLFFC